MIASCIRYCTFSSETAEGFCCTTFSIKVWSSPPRAASIHLIVGGSWQWSPARITRSAFRMAIQQAASSAWAASSINKVGKSPSVEQTVIAADQRRSNHTGTVEKIGVDQDFQFRGTVAQAAHPAAYSFPFRSNFPDASGCPFHGLIYGFPKVRGRLG